MKKNFILSFFCTIFSVSLALLTPISSYAQERLETRFIEGVDTDYRYIEQQNSYWWDDFKQRAVVSTGTNGRLDLFLQKLNRGEQVLVVADGGSITEGAGSSDDKYAFADRFVQGLKNRYPEAGIEYLNVGISAQPSGIGIMNYDRDVTLALDNRIPDLLLVDYSVNDLEDISLGAGYESMIRKALEKGDTAVILVHSVFEDHSNKQELYNPLGFYYGLPMISMKDALEPAYEEGVITAEQYYCDPFHPNDYGHFLMGECLLQLIDKKQLQINTYGESPVTAIPIKPFIGAPFTNLNSINSAYELKLDEADNVFVNSQTSKETLFKKGSFSGTDTELRASRRFGEFPFANNFMHLPDSGDEALTLMTSCKNILINYKTSSDTEFGNAIVTIDDKYICTLSGYEEDGYNNSNLAILLNEENGQMHVLRIYMEDSSKKFTIYNIAYAP